MVGMTLSLRPPRRKPRGQRPRDALTPAFVHNVSQGRRALTWTTDLPIRSGEDATVRGNALRVGAVCALVASNGGT